MNMTMMSIFLFLFCCCCCCFLILVLFCIWQACIEFGLWARKGQERRSEISIQLFELDD